MESYCKVFLILQFPSIWYALVLKYVILSKFIIKAEVCYLLKCYILAGVNDLMLHLVRLSPLLYLYYIFLLQLQEDHEAPANPKTDSLQLFFSGNRIWQKLLGGTCLLFFILLLLVEKLEILLNKHKEWHWFLCSLFLFNFINKNVFLISIFLCFALVPKLVPRTVDFHWYWYRILKFWYRDNNIYIYTVY